MQTKFWDLRRIYLDKNGAASLRVGAEGALKTHAELLIRLGEEDWLAKLKQARLALAYFERTGRKASELDLVSGEHPRWSPQEPQPETNDAPRADQLAPMRLQHFARFSQLAASSEKLRS